MTRRLKILSVLAACVALALAVSLIALRTYVNSQEKVNLTDDQVRAMIDRELPRGTNRLAVRKFLADKGWPNGDDGSTAFAMIRDAEHDFLIRKDIRVQFHFDPNDRLISYDLKAFLTGP